MMVGGVASECLGERRSLAFFKIPKEINQAGDRQP
jgi:hypothetical protein